MIQIPGRRALYIAMAGPHQIWKLDLEAGQIGVWAGSGDENIADGDLAAARFAQPSGLATDGKNLFVADSEVSGVRVITGIGTDKPEVGRIVGEGLFEFGDVDGVGPQVRLQHCLGVAYGDGKLFIADTYNNKIKVCDPKTRDGQDLRRHGQARRRRQAAPLLSARRPERRRDRALRGRHQQPQDPRDRPQDQGRQDAGNQRAHPAGAGGAVARLSLAEPLRAEPGKADDAADDHEGRHEGQSRRNPEGSLKRLALREYQVVDRGDHTRGEEPQQGPAPEGGDVPPPAPFQPSRQHADGPGQQSGQGRVEPEFAEMDNFDRASMFLLGSRTIPPNRPTRMWRICSDSRAVRLARTANAGSRTIGNV